MTISYGTRQPCDARESCRLIPCPQRDKPWVLATAILGSSLAFIESSVVNLALPVIQSDLDATSTGLQWVINAYLLVLGAFMLIGGSLGDRFGLRRIFILGTGLFGLGALACAFAPSLLALTLARVLQGLGGALLVPTSLALIGSHFPEHERGRAIGTWAGASALTTALGPVLGGWVVDEWGWAAVFLLVVPFAVLTILIAWWRVPAGRASGRERLDLPGALLLVAALGLLIHALVNPGAPALRGAWLVFAGLLAAIFVWRERRVAAPMLPLALFRSREFSGANLMTLLLYFALSGALYFLPFNLIQVQGYSALQAGAAFLPFTLLLGFGSTMAGDMIRRFNPRRVLAAGPLVTAAGFAALAIPGVQADFVTGFLPGILLIGIGLTLSVAPLTTVVMGAVSDRQAGVASGVNNTAARLAGVLAVAVLTVVAVAVFDAALDRRLEAAGVSAGVAAELLAQADRLAELEPPADLPAVVRDRIGSAIAHSYVETFRVLVLICGLLAALSGGIAWFSLAEQRPGGQREASPVTR